MKSKKTLLAISIASILTTGCTVTENQRTAIGAGIGAVAGGLLGHQFDNKRGRYVGAVLGALAGGAIGKYMDSQQEKLEKALASSGISVIRVDKTTIKLNIPHSLTFAVDKANLNPNAYGSLNSIASVINKYNKTALHVIGFADSDGKADYNIDLSKRRAEAVYNMLVKDFHVDPSRLRIDYKGDTIQPYARKNEWNRVVIFVIE